MDHLVKNRADVILQQQTTSEVANTYTFMSNNEELDPSSPQDISNVFAAAELLSCLSSDSDKYKRAWLKSKVIRSYILSAGDFPDVCSIS